MFTDDNQVDNQRDRRQSVREVVEKTICVNDGVPYLGGVLYDLSSGAAVKYKPGMKAKGDELLVDECVELRLDHRISLPASVVQYFEDGYAVRFDWGRERNHIASLSSPFA